MILGMERSPQGRLWISWIAGGDSELGYALIAYSDDQGMTWTPPTTVIDPHKNDIDGLPKWRVLVGNLWTDPQGRLWFFFDYSWGYFDGRAGTWRMICENPDSNEPVWSEPERIWHGAVLNKPTVLSTGEWYLPISLWDRGKLTSYFSEANIGTEGYKTLVTDLDPYRGLNIFKSTDNGLTWNPLSRIVFPYPNFDEPMIIERGNGTLWITARTGRGLYETISVDRGTTWSSPVPTTTILHPPARHFLRRLSSGNLLLVKHGEQVDCYANGTKEFTTERSHLTAFLSKDDGMTWQGGLLLDERMPVSYPDGTQAPDGTIFICYDYDRAVKREILMAKFKEADVLARELVTEGSQLKMLVNKATGP